MLEVSEFIRVHVSNNAISVTLFNVYKHTVSHSQSLKWMNFPPLLLLCKNAVPTQLFCSLVANLLHDNVFPALSFVAMNRRRVHGVAHSTC